MMYKTWRILLSVAFILLVFCAVRAVQRPAASVGAQRMEASADRARAEEAVKSVDAAGVEATGDLRVRQLETARDAQRIKQQETARELQRRQ
jgi:hypothetical protein